MVQRYSRPFPSVGMKHDAYYIVRSVCVLVCIMYEHILYLYLMYTYYYYISKNCDTSHGTDIARKQGKATT